MSIEELITITETHIKKLTPGAVQAELAIRIAQVKILKQISDRYALIHSQTTGH